MSIIGLEQTILRLAPPHVARAEAPASFGELCAQMSTVGAIVPWSGASDATIYSAPEINHAFRAWHDWHHWAGGLDFSPEAEARVCQRQIAEMLDLHGLNAVTERWVRILDAEINGQVAYFARWGRFPDNQRAFVEQYLG